MRIKLWDIVLGHCPIDAEHDQVDEPEDINQGTMKLIVGLIASLLGLICTALTGEWLDSISESYVRGGWARDVFVGSLFAMSVFLLSYLGGSRCEAWLSRIAALAALGVALFPCNCVVAVANAQNTCSPPDDSLPKTHAFSAGILFLILMVFCWIFYLRAKRKREAALARLPGRTIMTVPGRRMAIYIICLLGMFASIVALALRWVVGIGECVHGYVFWAESAGLFAFGISWLTASKVVPWLSGPEERLHPTRRKKPSRPGRAAEKAL